MGSSHPGDPPGPVVLVTSRFPWPPRRGNQVRTLEWLEALGGCDPVLLAPHPGDPGLLREPARRTGVRVTTFHAGPVASALGAAWAIPSGRPVQEGLFHLPSARRALAALLRERRPALVVVQMVRCFWALEVLRREAPGVPVLFDAIDAMGLHFWRAAVTRRGPLGLAFRWEARRCRALERRMAGEAAVTVAVARRDLEALGAPAGRGRVVPVAARERPPAEPGSARTVLLSGNLGYRPTVEGALWFASDVWPVVRRRVPGARWVLAGARPPRPVRRLAELPGVEVHADVPDLGPFLASARVAVAPMDSGSGVPMKVLEAWAAGVPVVARRWAAGGLVDGAGEAMVVADDPAEWAGGLARLLTDADEARRLGTAGRRLWEENYRPERVSEGIREAVEAALTSSR